MTGEITANLSEEEAALYDRQIRLWGLDGQTRVLLIGFDGIMNEVCKNLVLGGIGMLTVMDDHIVQDDDLKSQIFLRKGDIGLQRVDTAFERIQEMNPRVKLEKVVGKVESMTQDFFGSFDVVVFHSMDIKTLISVNDKCRNAGAAFYGTYSWGANGYVFCDAIEYLDQREEKTIWTPLAESYKMLHTLTAPVKNIKRHKISPVYFQLVTLFKFHEKHGRLPNEVDLGELLKIREELSKMTQYMKQENLTEEEINVILSNIHREIIPVSTIIGGILAQDIIRLVSKKGTPIKNLFLHGSQDFSGVIHVM